MKVRVYRYADGSVRVLHPNPSMRRKNETDDELLDRLATDAEEGDPSYADAVSTHDIRETDLPDQGDPE